MPALPSQKNQDLQALRFWALFFVILHHLPITKAYLPAFLTSGWTSVDLFFVISGFVIYKNFSSDLKKEGSFFEALQYFYIKRVFRILPLVSIYIFCVAYFVYFNRVQYSNWHLNHVFGFLISSFSFTTNYGIYLGLPTPAEALHLWSLNVEEHFYLLFPWSFYFFTYHF
jgi:peptidoglycan/LPS O-acetylase OafA/YrhL